MLQYDYPRDFVFLSFSPCHKNMLFGEIEISDERPDELALIDSIEEL